MIIQFAELAKIFSLQDLSRMVLYMKKDLRGNFQILYCDCEYQINVESMQLLHIANVFNLYIKVINFLSLKLSSYTARSLCMYAPRYICSYLIFLQQHVS